MGIWEVLLLAMALSMDAFAVAVCKGLAFEKIDWRQPVIVGAWFGIFQGLMPAIGYLVGSAFEKYVTAFDHWIAFVLLAIIGINMIKESFSKEEEKHDTGLGFRIMLVMAIATSIDAMAAGLAMAMDGGFAFSGAVGGNIPALLIAAGSICLVTFTLSCIGVKIGNLFGAKFQSKAELAGGIILLLLGTKILLEHLGILNIG